MKWVLVIISVLLFTGCNEKKIVENQNNAKVEENDPMKSQMESTEDQSVILNKEDNRDEFEKQLNTLSQDMKQSYEKVPVLEKEEQVIQQVNALEADISRLLSVEQPETIKEKVIEKFILLVDFIYYDEPIGTIYFKDLTVSAKENVLSIFMHMDAMIEKKLPNYKGTLKEKYQQALHYVKKQLDKVGEKIEKTIGEENYQNFVDAKDDLTESFQNTAEWIKEGSSKIYENGKEKVSNWYQEFKEKHEK